MQAGPQEPTCATSSAGTETSAEQFRKNPEVLCSSISWESDSDRTVWVYKVRLESRD